MTWEEPAKNTYEGRYTQPVLITGIEGRHIRYEGGGFPVPKEYASKLSVGGLYVLELQRGSTVAGVGYYEGETDEVNWIFRHDDHTLWSQWKEEVEAAQAKYRAYVDENFADWIERLEKLPETLRVELTEAIQDEKFVYDFMGFGYCLGIAEMAVLYKASDCEDDQAVNEYANQYGTSGNQHSMAQAIAQHRL